MTGTHPKKPTPLSAAAASALVPGLGQLSLGRKKIGWALVIGAVAGLGALMAILGISGVTETMAWLADPDVLLSIFVLNLIIFGIRSWSTANAWREAGGAPIRLTLVVMLLFVAVPHAALGYVAWQSRSALNEIFVSESIAVPSATTTASALPVTTVARFVPLVPPNTIPITTTTSTTLPLGTDRLTVLLLGGDAGPGRIGRRTDTIIVASIDTRSGDAVLFGLPRSMGGFEFSNGEVFTSSEQGLLNEVYRYGTWYPERFGGIDPGASAVMDVASHLLDLPIDYFVLVDLVGFAELIDAFGGVDVDVPRSIPAPVYDRETGFHSNITIEPGLQHMDGDLALAFARSRTGSSDRDRMGRQRCLLASFAEQLNPFTVLANFTPILDSLTENMTTDIPIDHLSPLMKLAPKVSMESTLVLGFDVGYRKGYTAKGLAKPDVDKLREAAALAISDPERARIELGIPAASEVCEQD